MTTMTTKISKSQLTEYRIGALDAATGLDPQETGAMYLQGYNDEIWTQLAERNVSNVQTVPDVLARMAKGL